MADLTLLNMNLLYVRLLDRIDREVHLPLGPLYIVSALEQNGFSVDFRDLQNCQAPDPFNPRTILDFLDGSSGIVGISVMTNLLPFALLTLKEAKSKWPNKTFILGGVGPSQMEKKILNDFPWVDIIVRGEGERTMVYLLQTLESGNSLEQVQGIFFRREKDIIETQPRPRITNLDTLSPAFDKVNLSLFEGFGVITSRGCPYPCTFCSVAPIWGRKPFFRSNENIIREMCFLHDSTGRELFLFQDEFFVSSKERVLSFCDALRKSGLKVRWKAFGRVDLTDGETMKAMAKAGCIELRYGIESGSDKILEVTKKGFTSDQVVEVVNQATRIFDRVDVFYIWGFPFETLQDFQESLFQMVHFRALGARVLPSLLCLLPQTEIYQTYCRDEELTFCAELMPEYMVTGHEIFGSGRVSLPGSHRYIFDFISTRPDLFPGFFLMRPETNIFPKLELLREFNFYNPATEFPPDTESCAAHSTTVKPRETSWTAGKIGGVQVKHIAERLKR